MYKKVKLVPVVSTNFRHNYENKFYNFCLPFPKSDTYILNSWKEIELFKQILNSFTNNKMQLKRACPGHCVNMTFLCLSDEAY